MRRTRHRLAAIPGIPTAKAAEYIEAAKVFNR
jgi:hypothetical protein